MDISRDEKTLTFKKKGKSTLDSAVIKVGVEFGNPYGVTALDYIENGFIPQIRHTYEIEGHSGVHYREPPTEVLKDGVLWASVSFYVDYDELQILYVTISGERVFILSLVSRGREQSPDEAAFEKAVDSFAIHPFL